MSETKHPQPSRYELTQTQWERIEDLLPGKASDPGRTAADNNPGDVRYPIMIGDLLLENGDTAGALSSYEAAHEIDPTSPYYPVSMANYY